MSEKKKRYFMPLPDQIAAIDWLKEHWEKRIANSKLSAQEIVDLIAREKGITMMTKANLEHIMRQVFPQWTLPVKSPIASMKSVEEFSSVLDTLESKLDQVIVRIENMERELGIRPLTSFLGNQNSVAVKR